jgi:bifunctional enzyme CysN/CysC
MSALALSRDALADLDPVSAAAQPARKAARVRTGYEFAESLNVLTCGSVDDGKSTLIGRLLWDTGSLHADQRGLLERSPKTSAGTPDFSLLVDGLSAEREQGITIDVAWRYVDTPARRLVIIDSPGHEQYTRNMASGATHADVAILLVDARGGIKEQTRRHAAILNVMGVQQLVLAVNKMDLVGWSAVRFDEIAAEFLKLVAHFGFADAAAIPVSAVLGDNVARASLAMPWYKGSELMQHLARIPGRSAASRRDLRFPVQLVLRAGQDFRGLAGTIVSGEINIHDEIVEPVSRRRARVSRIVTMGRDLESASQGQAVVLQLDSDIDISRGAMLAAPGFEPPVSRGLDARLVWLSDEPFRAEEGYLLRTATDVIPIASIDIRARLDLETLAERPGSTAAANEIAAARIDLGRRAAVDLFRDHRATGSVLLVDAVTGATVAGGVVTAVHAPQPAPRRNAFRLTRDLVARGVGADLPSNTHSEQELRRRADEVAILLREAGVPVELEGGWERTGIDAANVWLWIMAIFSFGLVIALICEPLFLDRIFYFAHQ